jgi:hypothetical protein
MTSPRQPATRGISDGGVTHAPAGEQDPDSVDFATRPNSREVQAEDWEEGRCTAAPVWGIPKNYFVRGAGLGADRGSVVEVGLLGGVVAAVEAGLAAAPVVSLVRVGYFRLVEVAEGEVEEAVLPVVEVVLLGEVVHTVAVVVAGEDLEEGVVAVGEGHWDVHQEGGAEGRVGRFGTLAFRMEDVADLQAAWDVVELEDGVEAVGIVGTPEVDDSVVLHKDCMPGNIVGWEGPHV